MDWYLVSSQLYFTINLEEIFYFNNKKYRIYAVFGVLQTPIKIQGRKGVACMIKYDPLWQTLKAKNISQYQLIKDYGIDKAQLQRLRQNMVVKTIILNRLY